MQEGARREIGRRGRQCCIIIIYVYMEVEVGREPVEGERQCCVIIIYIQRMGPVRAGR